MSDVEKEEGTPEPVVVEKEEEEGTANPFGEEPDTAAAAEETAAPEDDGDGAASEASEDGYESDPHAMLHNATAVSDESLGDMIAHVEKTKWGKIAATSAFLRASSSVNFFTCAQVADLLAAMTFPEERVDAVKILARKVVDAENLAFLYAGLKTDNEISAAAEAFSVDRAEVAAASGMNAAAAEPERPRRRRKKKSAKKDDGAAAEEGDGAGGDGAGGDGAGGDGAKGGAAGGADAEIEAAAADGEDPPADEASRVRIFVTDPEKVKGGIGGHMEYSVTARTSNEAFASSSGPVKRRFRHWVHMHDSLTFYNRNALVPALPSTKVTGRFDADFVEKRRRDLERYLNRVGSHPQLCNSPALVQFLQARDEEWDAALKAGKAELKADIKADKKDKGASAAKKLTHSKEMRALDEAHEKFEAHVDYVTTAAEKMEEIKKHLKLKLKAEEDLALMTEELGWLVLKSGVHEAEGGGSAVLGDALQVFARALATGIAKLRKLAVDVERVELLDAVREYLRVFEGARQLLFNRHQALKEYQVATEATNSAEAKVTKARAEFNKKANDKNQKKAADAEEALEEARNQEERRRLEFVTISTESFREMRRLHSEMRMDWRDILRTYIKGNAEMCAKSKAVFDGLIPEIEKLPARKGEWDDVM